MMTKEKSSKGITLVALVVTIIVLLLLAGIAISTLTNTGLFEKTRKAKEKSENAQIEENLIIGRYENKINEISGEVTGSRDNVSENDELRKQKTMSETEHFTGEYYLDNKPIYAKTIFVKSLPNKERKLYNHNIDNVDKIWFDTSKCYCIWSSGGVGALPHSAPDGVEYSIELYIQDKNNFRINTGVDRSKLSAYVTLNYTKTTD